MLDPPPPDIPPPLLSDTPDEDGMPDEDRMEVSDRVADVPALMTVATRAPAPGLLAFRQELLPATTQVRFVLPPVATRLESAMRIWYCAPSRMLTFHVVDRLDEFWGVGIVNAAPPGMKPSAWMG
jgi:hypothetical protein